MLLCYRFKRYSCTGYVAKCGASKLQRLAGEVKGLLLWRRKGTRLGPAPPPPIGSKSHAAHSVQPTIDNLLLTLQRRHEKEPSRVGARAAAGMIN